ncbi:HAD domain-containing protein [Kitasatospora sp. NPDC101801]|uniref:HAD domain-containing protein n=1 Tax=Kitasatospora sp. NPDC101801 TaxID=3364103 RepID=UPI00382F617C
MTALPLLFLDVDGPVIPFGADRPEGYPRYDTPGRRPPGDNPLLARADPALGPRLLALPCELVWATTWMAEANECVASWLGLPELPVVSWPEPSEEEPAGLHWKTATLVERAAGRPFVWVDDELTDADRAWVAARHPGPALLHRVDARCGLTTADFVAVDAWLRSGGGRTGQ